MVSEAKSLMDKIEKAKEIALIYPSQALKEALSAREEARLLKAKKEEAYSLFVMAQAFRSMTKLESCYEHAYDAYQIYEELDDQAGVAASLNLIGIVYFYNGMYEQALKEFLKALQLVKNSENHFISSRVYNNIGEIYREIGNLEEALIAYERALDISRQYEMEKNEAVILMNMGWIYFKMNNLPKSIHLYEKSYNMLLHMGDVTSLAEVENKMAKIYFLQQDVHRARQYNIQSLKRLENIENKYYTIEVLVDLAELELLVDEAAFLSYLYRGINYAEEIQARQHLSRIFKRLSSFFESKSQYNLALDYFKKYYHIEQVTDSTAVSHKLEIIKLELNKLFAHKEAEEIAKMNEQLENEISKHKKMVEELVQTNLHLSEEAFYDDLTQLANRKYVTKYLSDSWNEETASNMQVALLMIDIDHFKRYNDFHGHLEGDRCLKRVADCLKEIIGNREGVLGRFGGEEFVCFLKGIEQVELLQIAEKLRTGVDALSLLYCWEQHSFPVTISVGGVHGLCNQFQDYHEMYSIADEALYKAKVNGRNQVKIQMR